MKKLSSFKNLKTKGLSAKEMRHSKGGALPGTMATSALVGLIIGIWKIYKG